MTEWDDIVVFQRRLAETIEWCTPRADLSDPKDSLRTPNLTPIHGTDRYEDTIRFDWYTVGVGEAAVAHMASKRAEMLNEDVQIASALPVVLPGRLLLSEPLYSLDEALAQDESQGFFDCYDVPPWDTWVWLIATPPQRDRGHDRVCLISWVPPSLISLAQGGIDVNPMDCLGWAIDKVGLYPFLTELHLAGWLF